MPKPAQHTETHPNTPICSCQPALKLCKLYKVLAVIKHDVTAVEAFLLLSTLAAAKQEEHLEEVFAAAERRG